MHVSFRGGMGTREAILELNFPLQKSLDYNKCTYVYCLNYQNAFDKVQHIKLIEEHKIIGPGDKDNELRNTMYWKQTSVVKWWS